jgi:hypothetical protein
VAEAADLDKCELIGSSSSAITAAFLLVFLPAFFAGVARTDGAAVSSSDATTAILFVRFFLLGGTSEGSSSAFFFCASVFEAGRLCACSGMRSSSPSPSDAGTGDEGGGTERLGGPAMSGLDGGTGRASSIGVSLSAVALRRRFGGDLIKTSTVVFFRARRTGFLRGASFAGAYSSSSSSFFALRSFVPCAGGSADTPGDVDG